MNRKESILVVDDDEGIRKSLGLIIRRKNYRVETAGTGQEALQKAWGKDIKVALVDLKLPDMEGINLITPLKEMHPELAVIVITGFASIETAIQALNKGASAYITKPLNMDELCAKVEETLEKQRLLVENRKLLRELQRELEERSRVERALRQERDMAQKYLNIAGVILVVINRDQTVSLINRKGCDILGYGEEEIIGKNWIDNFIPERERDSVKTTFAKLMSGEIEAVEYFENLLLTKSGEEKIITWHNVVLRDESGNITGTLSSGDDITGRKMAEKALRESEEHYSALIRNLTDAVLLFKDGVITWCNDKVEEIYGYSKEELLGKQASFFYPNDISPAEFTRKLFSELKRYGFVYGNTKFQRKNEEIVDIEYSLSQINGKTPIEILAVARDVTQRKRVEEERERLLNELAEKTGQFEQIIYVTSHDLRSPLVNIQGFTKELEESFQQVHQILDSSDVPSPIKKNLAPILGEDIPHAFQYILASSSKMNSLLSGLLRLSRLGRDILNIQRLDMNKLMSEVVSSFEFQIREAGVTVNVEELPPCYGDETQLNQVFSNLLDNALKFLNPERPGIVRISGVAEKGRVIYYVEDNGIGIADKDREKIFEIFCRLDPDADVGEGLGLTIVRKILDRHGGKIWVESEPGKGSKFFVSLQTKEGANDKK